MEPENIALSNKKIDYLKIEQTTADNIKVFRNGLGMTQQDLADRLNQELGISTFGQSAISELENAKSKVHIGVYYALSEIFGCKPEDISGTTNKTYAPEILALITRINALPTKDIKKLFKSIEPILKANSL